MWEPFNNTPVTRPVLHVLVRLADLPLKVVRNLFVKAGIYPKKADWLTWLDRLLLSMGVLFGLFGLIFLLAFNWDELHKFAKLGLAQGGIVLAFLLLWFKPDRSFAQQMGITIVCVMTGILFALFGQIYQTGANAYDLFFNWTLTILPFVILARYAPLWMLWAVLANLTLGLHAAQVQFLESFAPLQYMLIMGNGAGLLLWTFLAGPTLKKSTWFPRTVLLYITILVGIGFTEAVYDKWDEINQITAFLIIWPLFSFLGIWLSHRTKDLFVLSMLLLSVVYGLTILAFEVFAFEQFYDDEWRILFTGLICLGLTTTAIFLLTRWRRQWNLLSTPQPLQHG